MGAPTSTTAILVLGDARLAALFERIRASFKEWAAQWGVAIESADVYVEENKDAEAGLEHRSSNTFACRTDHEILFICRAIGSSIEALLNLPRQRGPDATSGGEIAALVQSESIRSLIEVLGRASAVSDFRVEAGTEALQTASAPRPRGFALRIALRSKLSSAGSDFELWLSSNYVSKLLPTGGKPVSLAKRAQAIDTEKIRLRAVLGDAQVSVSDLATLAVDDVLVIQESPAAYLATDRGKKIAQVVLGRANQKRAVQITTLSNQR